MTEKRSLLRTFLYFLLVILVLYLVQTVIFNKITVYSFGVSTTAQIDNFSLGGKMWGEDIASFESVLELPGIEDISVEIVHLSPDEPLRNMSEYGLDFEEKFLFTSIRLIPYWKIDDIKIRNIIKGEEWQPVFEGIYYIEEAEGESGMDILENGYDLDESRTPKYGYEYILAYPFTEKSIFTTKRKWFTPAQQIIDVEYTDASGQAQKVHYELDLIWHYYYDLITAWFFSFSV